MANRTKEEIRQYNRDWYKKNKERIKLQRKEYYFKNKKECLKRIKAWREKNQDKIRVYRKKYKRSEKGRKALRRDNNSIKGKARQKKYRHSEKGRATKRTNNKRWRQTKKGKLWHIKQTNERRRNLSSIKLMSNPFPDELKIVYHHINNLLIVPIPSKLHQICNDNSQFKHRRKCNEFLFQIYNVDFDLLFNQG